jgi:hypothetical protein
MPKTMANRFGGTRGPRNLCRLGLGSFSAIWDIGTRPPGVARLTLGHQGEDLPLAGAQQVKRIVVLPGANQVLHQCRVDHRAAVGDPPQRLDELRDVFDAVFDR